MMGSKATMLSEANERLMLLRLTRCALLSIRVSRLSPPAMSDMVAKALDFLTLLECPYMSLVVSMPRLVSLALGGGLTLKPRLRIHQQPIRTVANYIT